MADYKRRKFAKSRIATIDICKIGKKKHHIAAFLEINISLSRQKFRKYKANNKGVSFTAWLVKVICHTIDANKNVAAFRNGKRGLVIFEDINASFLIEKEINGQRVPMPLVIVKANERSMEDITGQINSSKKEQMTEKDIVLHRKSNLIQQFYYVLPGFVRQLFWRLLLTGKRTTFQNMENVSITTLSMIGKTNGWFLPISIHPVCFGIGSITKKPVVIEDKIEIGEILNLSVLLDHDVIDGAPMARFVNELVKNIENGIFL